MEICRSLLAGRLLQVTAPEGVHHFDSTQIPRPPGPARRATSEMPGPFTRFDVINGVAQPVKRLRIGRPLLCGLSGSSLGSRHSTEASLEIGRPFRRRATPAGASGRQAFSVDRRGCSAGFPLDRRSGMGPAAIGMRFTDPAFMQGQTCAGSVRCPTRAASIH